MTTSPAGDFRRGAALAAVLALAVGLALATLPLDRGVAVLGGGVLGVSGEVRVKANQQAATKREHARRRRAAQVKAPAGRPSICPTGSDASYSAQRSRSAISSRLPAGSLK
jgi:hypothetical protein